MATDSVMDDQDLFNPTIPQTDPLLQPGSYIDAQNDANASTDSVMDDQDLSTPKKKAAAAAAADAVPETPSWLPEGWKMVTKVRESGATAGSTDRYYVEPTSGRRLRSRREVEYFLETGMKKKKTTPADGAANVQPSGTPGAGKRKKSSSGPKKSKPSDFDFEDVPEMVTWKLTDASNDDWVPFIDDKMVSSSTKQEWDAAMQSLTSGTD